MRYIKVEFEGAGIAYQEVSDGVVQRYLSQDGQELFVQPPSGDVCRVLDDEPKAEAWMAAETDFRVLSVQERKAGLKQADTDALVAEIKSREVDQKSIDELSAFVEAKKV